MSPPHDSPPSNEESPGQELRSLLSRASVAIVELTSTGRITAANDALASLTGHSRERLIGSQFTTVLARAPSSLESVLDGASNPETLTLTVPVETADGDVVACESHFKLLPSDDEDDHSIVGVLYRRSDRSRSGVGARGLDPDREGETASARAFVALADALSDGIIVLDTESEIQYANPAVERILGYAPDDLAGGSKLSIIPERLRDDHLSALDRYLETGQRNIDWEYVELPGQHEDGHEVPLGISLTDFVFEGDRYFVGLFRDISPRKEAERALREREQRLNRYKEYTDDVLNAIDDVFYVLDTSGNLRRWNRRGLEVTGYTEAEIESMNALEFFDEDDHEYVANAVEEGFRTGQNRIEADLVTKTGESIPYEFVGARLEDPDGEPVLAGIGRDVTERERQRRKLAESERRYRTLVENFPNGVVALFDEDLRYTAVGGELLDDLGFDRDDPVGTSVLELYPADVLEDVEPHFRAALDGEGRSFEVTYYDRHLSAYTLPVTDADDDISAGMLMVQDVTERREIRRRLEESNERLEQFAYAASHDLQEPLRMVTSYLQLLERRYGDDLDEDAGEFIEYAVDGADRMRDMIDGLLEYSRVETQGAPLEPVDLNTVLDQVRDDLQIKIDESGAEIAVDELPRVSGDADQLRQVFQNLLSNAIRYSGDEAPRVDISAERRGRRWCVSVRDRGVGIDPEQTDRVFQMFHRLHTQDEHAGTGLGLALCRRIVERHGGRIWVDSEPGTGSTFYFTLPDAP